MDRPVDLVVEVEPYLRSGVSALVERRCQLLVAQKDDPLLRSTRSARRPKFPVFPRRSVWSAFANVDISLNVSDGGLRSNSYSTFDRLVDPDTGHAVNRTWR